MTLPLGNRFAPAARAVVGLAMLGPRV